MKKGRMERLLKDSVNQRGEVKKMSYSTNNNESKNSKIDNIQDKEENINNNQDNKNQDNENTENINNNININNQTKNEKNIPLLIIDVNVRPGEKKKICVYNGDTPESLTEKFALENGIEGEIKSKLKTLIQTHMSRLLIIEEKGEETQSIDSEILINKI